MSNHSTHARFGPLPRDLMTVLEDVNAAEPTLNALSDQDLSVAAAQASRDPALQLAVAREVAARAIGERPHDVQVLGAAAMARGRVIEMLTGEGKTLVAAMAASALVTAGNGVHIATANDYLAARDAQWMGPIYQWLGVTVGITSPEMTTADKRAAYGCDVIYGTAREFAFDYLRDTLAVRPQDRVQRGHDVALIDEIDFVLLDEARVPFVITRSACADGTGLTDAARLVAALQPETEFLVDDGQRSVWLTEAGIERVEAVIGAGAMDDPSSAAAGNVQTALRARCSVMRDRDYVVAGGRVDIVDEFTGRVLPGRRWADGLHQAVEAKEGVPIQQDNRALAQITTHSYVGRYNRIVGMSGTVVAAARELKNVYGLGVVAIPSHRPVVRTDRKDRVFVTEEEKFEKVVEAVVAEHATGRPILIGTASVAHSEYLSELLDDRDIDHRVLNAKHHAAEAAIIAEAGRLGAVTVATNMAGRGVDIKLGGSFLAAAPAVAKLGGLLVIGTERHESRRVDDQLRGRAGRQGDPGESGFYVSLEDAVVVNHGPQSRALRRARPHRAIEVAQSNADTRNRDVRGALHEYDEVLDNHYAAVCRFRSDVVDSPGFELWTDEKLESHFGDDGAALCRYEAQRALAGAAWGNVQRHVMYAVLESGWSAVLETMYQLRNWVNLVVFGGDYPITEWRKRSDVAVSALRTEAEIGYLKQLMSAEIVPGHPPIRHVESTPETQVAQQLVRSRAELPRTMSYEPAYREPMIPDWAEGFAGPTFQEVVMVVDPSGADSSDGIAVVDEGGKMTVYLDPPVR